MIIIIIIIILDKNVHRTHRLNMDFAILFEIGDFQNKKIVSKSWYCTFTCNRLVKIKCVNVGKLTRAPISP